MHAMTIDDSYTVERVLARGKGGLTELVSIDGIGPFIRVRMPIDRARRAVWAALSECESMRLPRVALTYEMPDEFVAVYDYIPGDTLEHMVELRGKLDQETACRTLCELGEAVANLHEHGIIHCDLTPSNVIIAADGAHLIDMDIARMAGEAHKSEGRPLGTWGFAPPEQFGFAPVDERSDVYTLGRLLMYMLSGSDMGENAYDLDAIDMNDAPAWLIGVCRRASATEPSKRYQTVRELVEALEEGPSPYMEKAAAPVGHVAAEGVQAAVAAPAIEPPTTWEGPRNSHSWRARLRKMHPLQSLAYIAAIGCVVFGVVASVSFLSQSLLGDSNSTNDAQNADDSPASSDGDEDSQGNAAPNGGSAAQGDVALVVREYGYWVSDQGYVHYGVGLTCEGARGLQFATIEITGRDAAGSVVFSDTQTFGAMEPGEVLYYSGLAGNGTMPDSVEIAAVRPEEYEVATGEVNVPRYRTEGISTVEDELLGASFTGEVILDREGDAQLMTGDVFVSVILRDEDGSIVFGEMSFANAPEAGERSAFEVNCFDVPDYDTVEVYAVAW